MISKGGKMFEKLKKGQESNSNNEFTDAMKDVKPFGANKSIEAIESSTESLAELREKHPRELKEWCLNVEGNGDSEVSVADIWSKVFYEKEYVGLERRKRSGSEITNGPYLQAEDFLHAMRDKNPDKTVLMFGQNYDDGKKSGEDYYCVVDGDLDELELPDGYGYRYCDSDSYTHHSSCKNAEGYYTAAGEFVIRHLRTDLNTRHPIASRAYRFRDKWGLTDENKYNSFKDFETGQYFPEQFRIKVKKPKE